jgi:hypothetical protein
LGALREKRKGTIAQGVQIIDAEDFRFLFAPKVRKNRFKTSATKSFTDEELVNLTLAIITINGWNRLAITFRFVPGESSPSPQGSKYLDRKGRSTSIVGI